MSPQTDISGWPNIDQVSATTGISRRTLERELSAGKWQTEKRKRHGARAEVVFDPDQVAARMPAPRSAVVPASDSASVAKVAETQETGLSFELIAQVVAMAVQQVMGTMTPPQSEPQPMFVDLEEASRLTGLSVGCLRSLVKERRLLHVLDRRSHHSGHRVPKVRRADLETFGL